ncbi:hypothetical protein CF386_10450 [Paraphotobacterium marinum]|uniref:Uncharacterized protein n=1 Tax=Paraphotobacterium marinum TaxID=1755811 RepID=A0A220VGN7_9GAMM|nr:hypothetical protein [Paraphotobacterium marinum]ASK79471.1 hypothetical protein CF386_10450 [Paraphotobacterium marinum]
MKYKIIGLSLLFGLSLPTFLTAEQQELKKEHQESNLLSPSLKSYYESIETLHKGLHKNLYNKILKNESVTTLAVPKERIWPTNGKIMYDIHGNIIAPRVQVLMSTLIATQNTTDGRNDINRLMKLVNQRKYITVAQLNKLDGGAVWLTVAGKLKQRMLDRKSTWDQKLSNKCQQISPNSHTKKLDDNPKNPCNIIASLVGMYNPHVEDGQDYKGYTGYVNHVITFWIDKDAVVRPNKFQSIDNPNPGGFEVVEKNNNLSPLKFDFKNSKMNTKWLSPITQSVNKKFESYGQWYQNWAKNSFASLDEDYAWPFPWTGYGFTYDWIHSQPGHDSLRKQLQKGIGLAEFITVPTHNIDEQGTKNKSAIEFAKRHYVVFADQNGQALVQPRQQTLISEYLKS